MLDLPVLSSAGRSERERWLGGAAALVFGIALLGLPRRSFGASIAALGLHLLVLGALRLVRALEARRSRG